MRGLISGHPKNGSAHKGSVNIASEKTDIGVEVQRRFSIVHPNKTLSEESFNILVNIAMHIRGDERGNIKWGALNTLVPAFAISNRLVSTLFGEYSIGNRVVYHSFFTDEEWGRFWNWTCGQKTAETITTIIH